MESRQAIDTSASIKSTFSKRSLASVISLLILLLGMPLGGYLALNETSFFSKASTTSPASIQPSAGFLLETPKAVVSAGQSIAVDVLVQTDIDEANLFVAKLKYPTDLLAVEKIEAGVDSPIERWVESGYDNQSGEVSLVGGVTNPGLKTESGKKYILSTVVFKAKVSGIANLEFDSKESVIFRNSDNASILTSLEGLTVNVVGAGFGPAGDATSSSATANSPLRVISPNGGDVYNYLTPIEVRWEGLKEIEDISVTLFLNGQFLGKIGSNLDNTGSFIWRAEDSLPVSFVNSNNTFQIGVSGSTKGGLTVSDQSDGPFGLSLNPTGMAQSNNISTEEAADLNKDGKTDFGDLSLLFSNYNKPFGGKLKSYDLNKDGVISDIDLYFLMNFLVKNSLIKA